MTDPQALARAIYDHLFDDKASDAWIDPPEGLDLTEVMIDGRVNLVQLAEALIVRFKRAAALSDLAEMDGEHLT